MVIYVCKDTASKDLMDTQKSHRIQLHPNSQRVFKVGDTMTVTLSVKTEIGGDL